MPLGKQDAPLHSHRIIYPVKINFWWMGGSSWSGGGKGRTDKICLEYHEAPRLEGALKMSAICSHLYFVIYLKYMALSSIRQTF